MLSVDSDNSIHITQGNSLVLTITPMSSKTGKKIVLEEGDNVLFTVKSLMNEKVIQKILTIADYDESENLICEIGPEETVKLPIGEYYYDCLLCQADGLTSTFIASKIYVTSAAGLYTDITGGVDDG